MLKLINRIKQPSGRSSSSSCWALVRIFTLTLLLQWSPTAFSAGDYRLGVGDAILIQVHGEDDLKMEAVIAEKGTISYPFLGEIRVLGRSVAELQKLIVDGLSRGYLIHPEVSVTVTQYRQFFVIGEVKKPGGYPYVPGLTVRKAATIAGGFTERASVKKIFILRENDPKQEKSKIGLDLTINPGDTLVIEQGLF